MAALTLTAHAVLVLTAAFGLATASRADDAKATAAPTETSAARVKLDLKIAGLGPAGCDVEIAPGSPDCLFRPVARHVSQQDARGLPIMFDDVRTTGADRCCIFAVTIREPGQPVKTVRRTLRLVAAAERQESAQLLNCFLTSPSRLAKGSEMRERR
jgi:hypothetical protein